MKTRQRLETVLEGEGWRAARDGEEGVFAWLCVKEAAEADTQDLSLHSLSGKALGCPLGSRTPNLSKLQLCRQQLPMAGRGHSREEEGEFRSGVRGAGNGEMEGSAAQATEGRDQG